MLRKWAKMKKYQISTTAYCAYGFPYAKPTDFFNNFPRGINLKDPICPYGKKLIPIAKSGNKESQKLTRDITYRIPAPLVSQVLKDFVKQYKKIKPDGKKYDVNRDSPILRGGIKPGGPKCRKK
jgi:hypothetical protein